MLRLLRVRHFALIDDLTLEFDHGFNLLSGETGAGKSLVVDALALVAGRKASADAIRSGERRALVEAVFDAPETLDLDAVGIDAADELVIRREVAADNRNRVFINSQPSTVAALRTIASELLDIHGQHEQQTLLAPAHQLALVDRAAGAEEPRRRVRAALDAVRTREAALQDLERSESVALQRLDLLRFQREELERAGLQAGEAERLREQIQVMRHSGRLLDASRSGYETLYEAEESLLSRIAPVLRAVRDAAGYDARLEPLAAQLAAAAAALEDAAFALRDYARDIDMDPAELERLSHRLADLEALHRKYGPDLGEHLIRVQEELDSIGLQESHRHALAGELAQWRSAYAEAAEELSRRRRAVTPALEEAVTREIRSLAMPEAQFSIRWTTLEEGRSTGVDAVDFLLSPNRGEPAGPLAAMASGGELSRTMLALRRVMAGDGGERTLVFDEIDAGIGGEAADTVGRKLKDLSRSYQVLCVTHLPQIARFADRHIRIEKNVVNDRTVTRAEILNEADRVEEIARMISGGGVTDAGRRHVRELLRRS